MAYSGGPTLSKKDIMILRQILKSKIHRATVTDANVDYVGSITVDKDLLERAGISIGEHVHVWNVDNGERFETYAMEAPRDSRVIVVNGAGARKVEIGHRLIIASFALTDEPIEPQIILVDETNRFTIHVPLHSQS